MKPVDQSRFGATEGDCFTACVASILELTIEQVPRFCAPTSTDWWSWFLDWCSNRDLVVGYGRPGDLGPWWYTYRSRFDWTAAEWDLAPPPGYAILTGTSPRYVSTGGKHAVVTLDGELVHDPRVGDRRGVLDVYDWITITR